MKQTLRTSVVGTVLLMWIALCCALAAENAPPQRGLRTYALHGNPNSADISPDERLVVTVFSRSQQTDDPSKIKTTDVVQLWDFRQDKLIAENALREEIRDKGKPLTYARAEYVRYSADGQLVIAYLDHCLYLLRGTDLREVRRMQTSGPPEVSHTYKTKSGPHPYVVKSELAALELSPVEHQVAVVWVRGFAEAWVDIVQFDSAQDTVWNTRERGLGWMNPTAVAWTSDGHQLVVAVPNEVACNSPGSTPDVFAVQPLSGAIQQKLTTGLLVGDIAVTPDSRVLVVDRDCVGVFENHHPPLRVFDLRTGKKIKELTGWGGGVRYAISVSRNGGRAVADTGIVKARFDWGDMVPFDVQGDSTFSVWNLKNYEGLVTSQNLMQRMSGRFRVDGQVPLRISPNGGFVLRGNSIYELP